MPHKIMWKQEAYAVEDLEIDGDKVIKLNTELRHCRIN